MQLIFCDRKNNYPEEKSNKENRCDQTVKLFVIIMIVFLRIFQNEKEQQAKATNNTH